MWKLAISEIFNLVFSFWKALNNLRVVIIVISAFITQINDQKFKFQLQCDYYWDYKLFSNLRSLIGFFFGTKYQNGWFDLTVTIQDQMFCFCSVDKSGLWTLKVQMYSDVVINMWKKNCWGMKKGIVETATMSFMLVNGLCLSLNVIYDAESSRLSVWFRSWNDSSLMNTCINTISIKNRWMSGKYWDHGLIFLFLLDTWDWLKEKPTQVTKYSCGIQLAGKIYDRSHSTRDEAQFYGITYGKPR